MAIFARGDRALAGLVHHSDRGTQGGLNLSIRYTERLEAAGVVNSVGSRGDWRTVDDVELATSAWVHWWNSSRLHGACGDVPPAEYEAAYWATRQATIAA